MILQHKQYIALIVYDEEFQLFHGEIINLKDVITFQATSIEHLEDAFEDSIEDYLEWCAIETDQ
jgi:predicted HicB family RNase H-like nuclease